jgi:hypothetical protein
VDLEQFSLTKKSLDENISPHGIRKYQKIPPQKIYQLHWQLFVHFRRLGLATLVGMSLTILGGIMAKYSNTFRNYIRPINIKLYHATAGMVIFMLAMVVASLATYSNWFHNRMGKVEWVGRICMWAPIILAVCVARQVTQSYLPRILEPRQSELDAKAKAIQAKIDAKLKNEKVRKDNWRDDFVISLYLIFHVL